MIAKKTTYKTVKASHFKKLQIIQKKTWRKVLSGKRLEKMLKFNIYLSKYKFERKLNNYSGEKCGPKEFTEI